MKNVNNGYIVLGDIHVASQELKNWVELLTNNDEVLEQRFRQLYETKGTVLSAIMNLRRELLTQSNQQELNMDEMEQFRQQLENMFWEPVSIGYSKTIKRVMQINGFKPEDIVKEHMAKPEKRIWQIICCKNQYIA